MICESVCPNEAIYFAELLCKIDSALCTECVGHFEQPQYQDLRPVDCIALDPNHEETQEELLTKYCRLSKGLINAYP